VETLFKQIQDCADFYEAGGMVIGQAQQINLACEKIFATGNFTSTCRRCHEKESAEKIWVNFKVHFAAAHRHHKQMQMQGESADNYGYHAANAAIFQTEYQLSKATIGELFNLATAPEMSNERGVVATLTGENMRLSKQLEERSNVLKEVKALLKRSELKENGRENSTLLWKMIAGQSEL
jgi:hypothetical protein